MFKRLLLCFTLLLTMAGAKADETAYWTLTFPASEQESVSSYATTWTASMTEGGAWSIYAFNNNNSGWAYIRCGNKSVAYNEDNTDAGAAYIATTTAAEQAISKVVVTVDKVTTTDLYKDPYLVVATDADFSDVVETVTLSSDDLAAGDWSFDIDEATEDAYYKLVFNMNSTSSNGTLQISQVAYYYEAGESEEDTTAECDTLYIVGNKDNAWGSMSASDNYDVLVEAVAGSKVYYNEALEVSLSSQTTGWFAFYTELDPTWSGDPKLGPSTANETITAGTAQTLISTSNSFQYDSETVGTYTVTVDLSDADNMTVLFTSTSSEDEDEEEEEETTVDTLTVAEAIALVEANEYTSDSVYVKGIVSQIDSVYYTYYGNANYYISDDGATDSQLYIYRGLGLNGASFTSADDLLVGDTLILYGVLTAYYSTPEMAAKNYIVYQGRPESTDDEEEEEETTAECDTLYIVGNKDNAWGSMSASDNYDVLVEAVAGSKVYYNEALEVSLSSQTTGWFAFYTELDPTWSGDPKLGPSTANETITVGTAQTLISTSNSFQYDSETVGTYSVTVDLSDADNMTVLFTSTSSEDEEEEEEETTVDTLTVAEAIALVEANEYTSDSVYVKGIVSQIDSVYYTYYGNANYYISDDGATDSQLYIYRGLGLNGASFTSADDLLVGDTLILYGVLTSYYSTPEMAAKNYIVYQGRPESTDDEEEDGEGDTDDSSEYVYTLVTDASTLAEGDVVTIVNETYSVVIGENNSTYFGYSSATIVDNTIAASEVVTPITLEAVDGGYWKLQLSDGSYLYAVSSSSNQLGATTETLTDSSDIAAISIAQDESTSSYDATILFQKSESDRTLIQYNNGTYGRFSCYKSDGSSNQNPVQLYRRTEGTMPEVIDTLTVAEAIALIEAGEYTSDSVYVKGIVSQIDSVYYTYYGNANYYISDDGATDSQLYIYRGLGLNGASFTSADDLLVGDTLILYGVLTSYYSTPEMAAKNYIVYQGKVDRTTEEEDEEEDTTTYDVYAKTSEITSGQSYLIVVQDGTNTLYATNHSASYTYGYLYTNTVSGLTDTLSVDASEYNAFVITASETTDGAYTIQDSYGRYLYQSGTYKSFNLSTTNDSYDWTIVANEDGTWTITYASTSYWMQYSTSYSSFGVYSSEQDNALLPYLYELVSSDEEGEGDDTGDNTGDDDEEDTTEIVAYYTLVTDADDLSDGDTITIVNEQYSVAISALASNGNYFTETAVTIADDTLAATADVTPVILSATDDGNWLLTLEDGTYMAAIGTGSSNYLGVLEEANDTSAVASIAIALDEEEVYYSATILFQSTSNRNLLQYNHTNTRFSCYKSDGSSTQYPVQIYSKVTTSDDTPTAISSVETEGATLRQGVYTLTGVRLNSADNLPAGIYIVDGQKVLVK